MDYPSRAFRSQYRSSDREMRIQRFVLLLLAVGISGCSAMHRSNSFDYLLKVGSVVDDFAGGFVLDIQNSAVAPGTPISVVVLDDPQTLLHASVVKKQASAANSPTMIVSGEAPVRYDLKLEEGAWPGSTLGIAVLQPLVNISTESALVSADIDGDGEPEFFRQCASTEGIHLGVRSGTPIVGEQRWHAYYYLGYDVEPNCRPGELEE